MLKVEATKGRGGKAGLQYQVRVDSLPIDLQSRINAPSKALSAPGKLPVNAAKLSTVMAVFDEMFAEIDATQPNTKARANIFRAWSNRLIVDVKGGGHSRRYSVTTLQRFYREHQEAGLVALARKGRSDKGRKRVVMTARFDAWARGAGLPDLEAIAENLKSYIRGSYRNWESVTTIRVRASRRLEELTRAQGFDPPTGVCEIPANVVKCERVYLNSAIRRKDNKAHHDSLPSIRRTIDGLRPMDIIVGDVHPLDFLLPEVPGWQQHAKAICWLDVATKRLWVTVTFLRIGEGVRNSHVIASFIQMATAWGLPKSLYLDNGSEYNFADFISDALALVSDRGERVLIRSKPYNARAKPIEGVFAVLAHLFRPLPGYIGGNRMRSKVANVGKAPVPFAGTFDQFREIVGAVVTTYHARQQRGQLGGLSPTEAYNRAIETGWHKTEVSPDAFFMAFASRDTRVVRGNCISVGGRFWTCDALASYLGKRVVVLIPKFESWDRLPVEDMQGNLIDFVQEAKEFEFLDTAGARESSRIQTLRDKSVAELSRSAAKLDPVAEVMADAARALKPLSTPVMDRFEASDKAIAFAQGVKQSPKERDEIEEAGRRRRHQESHALHLELMENIRARKT